MDKRAHAADSLNWFDEILNPHQASEKSKENADRGRRSEAAATDARVRKREVSFASLVRKDPTNEKVRCLMNGLASRGGMQACPEHPYWKELGITGWKTPEDGVDEATARGDLMLETYRKADETRLREMGHTGFVPNEGEDGSVPWNRELGWH